MPDWTDEFEVAMRTADPSAPRDSWKLTEGFVATEGSEPSSVNMNLNFQSFRLGQVQAFGESFARWWRMEGERNEHK